MPNRLLSWLDHIQADRVAIVLSRATKDQAAVTVGKVSGIIDPIEARADRRQSDADAEGIGNACGRRRSWPPNGKFDRRLMIYDER